jgi:hypothetical protein
MLQHLATNSHDETSAKRLQQGHKDRRNDLPLSTHKGEKTGQFPEPVSGRGGRLRGAIVDPQRRWPVSPRNWCKERQTVDGVQPAHLPNRYKCVFV